MKQLKVIITGTTGMIGEWILHICLNNPQIKDILIINRSRLNLEHPKLTQIIHKDLSDISSLSSQLEGYDACYFCLGTTSMGKSKETYEYITYDLTMGFARTLQQYNPMMTFCYVSGQGTDETQTSRMHRARTKGKTENDLDTLGFAKTYAYRPGFIQPMAGMTKTLPIYRYVAWLYPLRKFIAPNRCNTLIEIAKSMIFVSLYPYDHRIMNGNDIRTTADVLQ